MKLDISFSALWSSVTKMGAEPVEFNYESVDTNNFELDTELSSSAGIEIELDEIEADGGVLSYQGRQILLFIPDQGWKIDKVLENPSEGKKYHVADCRTLNEMRRKKRFERYKATNNLEGVFKVYGTSEASGQNREGEAELKVCKNCLSYLNYQGYKTNKSSRSGIHSQFDIPQFLSHFSTLFSSMPPRSHFFEKGGYAEDWAIISAQYRSSKMYCCEVCQVNLNEHRKLLHTHHINGNKRDNRSENLKALCIDCHRKQPFHDYMRVSHQDMTKINQLRRHQHLLDDVEWAIALDMADTSLRGGLLAYKEQGYSAPTIGYMIEHTDTQLQLEVAWPETKFGIAVDTKTQSEAAKYGWSVQTIGEVLRSQ